MPDVAATSVRKIVTFPRELVARVEDYRFQNRIRTESEAIRRLIELGLASQGGTATPVRRALEE